MQPVKTIYDLPQEAINETIIIQPWEDCYNNVKLIDRNEDNKQKYRILWQFLNCDFLGE